MTLASGLFRLAALHRPRGLVFDEIFYARDACWYVAGTESICGITDLASRTHPPLGKWLIGSGIALFGYEPFGWRVAAAVAGTLTVALLFVLAWRLLRPIAARHGSVTIGAVVAAVLLGTDFLHLVQSRIAMLDVFIALFVVGAMLGIVLDRDRPRDVERGGLIGRLTLGHPWRLAAGACLGAAAATKWSGAYVALAVIGLTVAWEIGVERRGAPSAGWKQVVGRAVRREALPTVLLLGLVPVIVYVASYTGRMPGDLFGAPWQPGSVWWGIWDHQRAMLEFHTGLAGHHPYESPAWSWLALKRPVAYFFEEDVGGRYREILAVGNPLVWWSGFVATVGLAVAWTRRGADPWHPTALILAGILATWGPWLVLSNTRSQTFLWYLLPTIPFLCLALGVVASRLWETLAGKVVVAAYAGLVVASFAFYVPMLTGLPLDPDGWRLHVPFRDCDRPGAATLRLPDDQINEGPPPEGWCWI